MAADPNGCKPVSDPVVISARLWEYTCSGTLRSSMKSPSTRSHLRCSRRATRSARHSRVNSSIKRLQRAFGLSVSLMIFAASAIWLAVPRNVLVALQVNTR